MTNLKIAIKSFFKTIPSVVAADLFGSYAQNRANAQRAT